MVKEIIGYIGVDSHKSLREIWSILNEFHCDFNYSEESGILLLNYIEYKPMEFLSNGGWITESDMSEIGELDTIKFYVR